MREQYPLEYYIPDCSIQLTGAALAEAYLQRSCIMFRNDLIEEGIEDLTSALHQMPESSISYGSTKNLASKSLDIEPWKISRKLHILRKLNDTLLEENALKLSLYYMRGLFWASRRALYKRDWHQMAQSISMLGYFAALQLLNPIRRIL